MKLAYRAHTKGATEDAHALASLALAAPDAANIFDKNAAAKSTEDSETFFELLEGGEVDQSLSNGKIEQTGYGPTTMANVHTEILALANDLAERGFPELAIQIKSCLE